MAIIGTLPVSLANGTTADATQVMSDFNFIQSQVNSNAASLAGGNAFTGAQTVGGDAVVTATATQTLVGKTFNSPMGTVALPTYSFSGSTSTGMWEPVANTVGIATNGTNAVYVDANQNTGFGVTPSSWGGSYKVIEFSNGCFVSSFTGVTPSITIGSNNYFNGTNNILKISGAGATYGQTAGVHTWSVIASGAAGSTAVSSTVLTLDNGGRLYGSSLHNNATLPTGTTNQYIASGTYTPTPTSVTNVSTATPGTHQWIRVGNVVTVSGTTVVTTPSTGPATFRLTLPIASSTTNLSGTIGCQNISGAIVVSGSSQATVQATVSLAANSTWSITFTYEVT